MTNTAFPWQTPIQYIKGVGPKRAFLFSKLNIHTLEDLLYFIPFRYEDRRGLKKISEVTPGEIETVLGKVEAVGSSVTARRRMKIVDVAISDASGIIHAKWFNQPYLLTLFKKGDRLMLNGRVKKNPYSGFSMDIESPQFEKVEEHEDQIHINRIVPIYHETKGITSKQIRFLMKQALDRYADTIPDMLPSPLIQKHTLLPLSEAIKHVHFPPEASNLLQLNEGKSPAHRRLAFDELFLLELGLALRQKEVTEKAAGMSFNISESVLARLLERIPFQLTGAQHRVLHEILQDMAAIHPMHRLIQGDVGSGKTVLALIAIMIVIENQYQAAIMAPTEILAEQHYLSLKDYVEHQGKSILLLTSDMKKQQKESALEQVRSGQVDLVVGTHALIQQGVTFKCLGLAVVDEQHKFGVLQRAKLAMKGSRPDLLIMTATPIPRTLAMTLYGDLNISIIDELPPGRTPVRTRLFYGKQRNTVYRLVETALSKGRQAYVVCPLVEASEKLDLKASVDLFEHFQKSAFPNRRIGLLHGRMAQDEKEEVMRRFKDGAIDLLVATTVVEVGIDIPNATVMVIEHAERFGLSQLHQLRGRVGRGREASTCLMIAEHPISQEGKRRLQAMLNTTDGFKIAEEDLTIRGPGEFFGTRQSGLPVLHVANLIRDFSILKTARQEAFKWIENNTKLEGAENRLMRDHLERKWQAKLEWLTLA
ncbi:MAG: ATP-dependent DNA helicase RecG [Nitrospiria bacterium]